MGSTSEMIQKLEPYFIETPSIVAAYLFGSFAHGRQRPSSDVDIAVLLDERVAKIDRGLFLDEMHRKMKQRLGVNHDGQ